MATISRTELVEILKRVKGATFASVTYVTDESKSKTVNKKKLIQKEVVTNITLNANYEAKVNRIAEQKQGQKVEFKASSLIGREYAFKNCKTILKSTKNGDLMINAMVENNHKPKTTYFHEGVEISREEMIKQNLVTPSFTKPKTSTSGRGLIKAENDFKIINTKLDKITKLTLNRVTYVIK